MNNPKVQVLLSTYNGAKYIVEQVMSILNQVDVEIKILIRDDGSDDNTIELIRNLNEERIQVLKETNIGSTKSFIKLLYLAEESDYYAFADQDDIWDSDKLIVGIQKIMNYDVPAIYSSNTRIVDSNLNPLGTVERKPKTDLGSALVKNYVAGCTVVFNNKLMQLLKMYEPTIIPYHDWWINLVALANDGVSIYDEKPHMSYRQHGDNVVGAVDDFGKKWKSRLKKFKENSYRRDLIAKQLLNGYGSIMPQESLDILTKIENYKKEKCIVIKDKRFRTNSRIDNILFYCLVITNKA